MGKNFLFIINIFQDRNYCGIEFEWGNTPVAGLPYLIPLDRSKNDCSWLILVPIEDFNKLKSFF